MLSDSCKYADVASIQAAADLGIQRLCFAPATLHSPVYLSFYRPSSMSTYSSMGTLHMTDLTVKVQTICLHNLTAWAIPPSAPKSFLRLPSSSPFSSSFSRPSIRTSCRTAVSSSASTPSSPPQATPPSPSPVSSKRVPCGDIGASIRQHVGSSRL